MDTVRAPAVLVVEDEPLVALDIAGCIEELGFRVVGPVAALDQAVKMAESGAFDAALVDANLGGHKVDTLAATLANRQIPFAFVTGYGRETLPEAFRHLEVVAKPYTHERLNAVIKNLIGQTGVQKHRSSV